MASLPPFHNTALTQGRTLEGNSVKYSQTMTKAEFLGAEKPPEDPERQAGS